MFKSTRTCLDEVKKLQLAAEFLVYRDPVKVSLLRLQYYTGKMGRLIQD